MTDERKPERTPERRTASRKGPLHVPEYLRKPGFRYRFIKYSREAPYRMDEKLDVGWTPTPISEAQELRSKHLGLLNEDGIRSEGGYVTKPINDKELYYLCQIPEELAQELDRQKQADIRQKEIDMLYGGRKPGFYGTIEQDN